MTCLLLSDKVGPQSRSLEQTRENQNSLAMYSIASIVERKTWIDLEEPVLTQRNPGLPGGTWVYLEEPGLTWRNPG